MLDVKLQFATLFRYHWATTHHLIDCAARLSQEDYFQEPGFGHGSIHAIFFHLLRADHNWRRTIENRRQVPPMVQIEDFQGIDAIRSGMNAEQAAWNDLFDSLSEDELTENLSLLNRHGEVLSQPGWRILQHILFHGMQHHSELAQLLTIKEQSPGNIDLVFFAG